MRTLAKCGGVFYKTLLLVVYAGIMEKYLASTSTDGRGVISVGSEQGYWLALFTNVLEGEFSEFASSIPHNPAPKRGCGVMRCVVVVFGPRHCSRQDPLILSSCVGAARPRGTGVA